MSRIFVAGLINIETTLAVSGFPIHYNPANFPFFGIKTTVSGVGFNIAKALTVLDNQVNFASLVGSDENGNLAFKALEKQRISDDLILDVLEHTAQSVILYDPQGRRQIYTDLKDIQSQAFPVELTEPALQGCDLAVICNINFARPLLGKANAAGKWIATDVHAIPSLDDAYNQDYMGAADILFMSDELLPAEPEAVAQAVMGRFPASILVIGMGEKGALMCVREDQFMGRFDAVKTRPVVNSIGAGDALFSAFIDCYCRIQDPYRALQAGMVFASYKIGEKGAAEGFLSRDELAAWIKK